MNTEDFDTSSHPAHRVLFDLQIAKATGNQFQALFERIMEKHDPSFSRVKPGGPVGDWKSDGYSGANGTIFQCYAPETIRAAIAVAKITEDFAGAKQFWGKRLKRWAFVVNKDALPPQVIATLNDLKQAQAPLTEIDWYTPERFWCEIVAHLQSTELDDIFGRPPLAESAVHDLVKQAWKALRAHQTDEARSHCKKALEWAGVSAAHRHDRADVHQLLAHIEIKAKNPEQARRHIDVADSELHDGDPASFRINSHRLRAASWDASDRHDLAETHYLAALEIEPSDHESADELKIIDELKCFARADLVINGVRFDRMGDLSDHVDSIEAFAHAHPSAQDGHLLLHIVNALIVYHAKRQDEESATRSLNIVREMSTTKELAFEAASLLQHLTGRAAYFKASEIAIACANLSAELSSRAERPDFYWAAQANLVSVYLSTGQIELARRQLKLLDPVLRNEQVNPEIKAGILSLAAAVLARSGEPEQAITIMEKAQQQMRAEPRSVAFSEFERGRYLVGAGRTSEALSAFQTADRLGRETKAPREFLFHINVELMKSATELGCWVEAEAAFTALQDLPRAPEFVEDVMAVLRKQLDGTRVIKKRLEEIRDLPAEHNAGTLAEANAEALRPLVTWWRDYLAHSRKGKGKNKSKSGEAETHVGSLGVLYDYWGGGGAAKIMANLRHRAPDHFTPFVEVRTVHEVRRAIRMLTLVSDCLVLLWKGNIESGMAVTPAPFDHICGGAGYMAALGDKLWVSKETGPWFPIMGHGAFLPREIIKLLTTDALPLIEQGRLIVLPAPAVGCHQDAFGPAEQLLAELMSATPFAQAKAMNSAFPLGILPYFEDAPLGVMADLVAKNDDATRRLRLALVRKTNDLRVHGSVEITNREIVDEIADALASLDGTHRGISRKRGYVTRHDAFGASAVSFQKAWAPLLTLKRLGYRMTLTNAATQRSGRSEQLFAKEGTPFGNWLHLPGQNVTVPMARRILSTKGEN